MDTELLVIDPQIDFCDPAGALSVAGADDDMRRLAAHIRQVGSTIDQIHVTLDSHHLIDIAHPLFWRDVEGHWPAPFTIITAEDVESERLRTAHSAFRERALAYVRALAEHGRYPLCIWPPHCLIGSAGHAVYPELFGALKEWEALKMKPVNYIFKGENIWTEHYSAIQADVPDPNDPATQLNRKLVDRLAQADAIFVAGEAGSHCVANTVRDLADNLPSDAVSKITLLTDTTSPVPGFEALQEQFIADLTARGMQLTTTEEDARSIR
jgi:nicotinamidase-related amidase